MDGFTAVLEIRNMGKNLHDVRININIAACPANTPTFTG